MEWYNFKTMKGNRVKYILKNVGNYKGYPLIIFSTVQDLMA